MVDAVLPAQVCDRVSGVEQRLLRSGYPKGPRGQWPSWSIAPKAKDLPRTPKNEIRSAGICGSVSGQIPGLLFADGNPRAVETLYEATGT